MKHKIKVMFFKINTRLHNLIVKKTHNKFFYPMLYKSWWHMLFNKNSVKKDFKNYFAARPNQGAGIGHQMANWIAGYWFAKQFELKFAHLGFSTQEWEEFLGFGKNEMTVKELISKGYTKIQLPLFDEFNQKNVMVVKRIIDSYTNEKVVFVAEQDQFYYEQYGVMKEIKQKFDNAHSLENSKLIYNKEHFNIAIHVRRGDITIGQLNQNPNLLMRWQDNDYFFNVLENIMNSINTDKTVYIYLFSQGKPEDFSEFNKFENIKFCLDMGAQDSFLHMVYADLLITSKSSFSYKPALLSNGIKICPDNFWHGYPKEDDWLLADANGSFDAEHLRLIVEKEIK